MAKGDPQFDPKALIREAYRIDGITPSQCRSVFLDWALSLPDGTAPKDALCVLIDQYGPGTEDHPMTQVLRDGLTAMSAPRRRGGWRSRPRN